jgi:hypothetical protein
VHIQKKLYLFSNNASSIFARARRKNSFPHLRQKTSKIEKVGRKKIVEPKSATVLLLIFISALLQTQLSC